MRKLYFIAVIFLGTYYPLAAQTTSPLTSSETARSEQASLWAARSPASNPLEKLWATGKNTLADQDIHLGMDISYLAQRAGLDRGKHAVIVWGLRTTLML